MGKYYIYIRGLKVHLCTADRSKHRLHANFASATQAPPSTTIVPFASLPSCAVNCGPLYDANGACVPPANPATDEGSWDSCFCNYGSLQPLKSGPSDVCKGACNADPQGLPGIQNWFTSLCNKAVDPTATTTSAPNTGTGGANAPGKNQGSGGGW